MAFNVGYRLARRLTADLAYWANYMKIYFTDGTTYETTNFVHDNYDGYPESYWYALFSVNLNLTESKTVDKIEVRDEEYEILFVKDDLNLALPAGSTLLQEKVIIRYQVR
jgi:hypothetical protein